MDIVPREQGKLKGVVKSVLFKGVHYETMVETKVGTEITVKMQVSNDQPVFNEAANEKMSANDFYLDVDDVEELDEATIIARADAQAWNPDEDELISIKEVKYNIKKEKAVKRGTVLEVPVATAVAAIAPAVAVPAVILIIREQHGINIKGLQVNNMKWQVAMVRLV